VLKKRDLLILSGLIVLLTAAVLVTNWLQSKQAVIPYAVVTTITGDAGTSRAFTWYTESKDSSAVVQVMERDEDGGWESERMIEAAAVSTAIVNDGKSSGYFVHKATVEGLSLGTTYSYRVGSKEQDSWSGAAQFTTSTKTDSFQFLYVADSQGETEADFELWGKTLNAAFQHYPEASFIVHTGDAVEEPGDEQAWTYFFEKAQKWLTQIPLMPATGNHDEIDGDASAFTSHFNLPDNGAEGSLPGTTYTFQYGNALFIYLNSESNIDGQTKWLRERLEQADQEWIIAVMHQGPYGGKRKKALNDWVELFDEYKVDLVLQGHNHEYSRSYPLRNGEIAGDAQKVLERAGTIYAVANTSGQKFNAKKKDLFYHAVHFQNEKQMFVGITINGKQLVYEAYDVEGQKLDEFVLQH